MTENELKLKYKSMRERFKGLVQVDKSRLTKEMTEIASNVFVIGDAKAQAEYDMGMAEKNLEVVEARIDKKLRTKPSGKRKPSEAELKRMVARHSLVIAAHQQFAEAKYKFNVCWAAVNAITQKGTQLSNLAYNYRKELDSGMASKVRETKAQNKGKEYLNKKGRE